MLNKYDKYSRDVFTKLRIINKGSFKLEKLCSTVFPREKDLWSVHKSKKDIFYRILYMCVIMGQYSCMRYMMKRPGFAGFYPVLEKMKKRQKYSRKLYDFVWCKDRDHDHEMTAQICEASMW